MTQEEFMLVIPTYPLCADKGFIGGSKRLPREKAILKPLIQPNAPNLVRFLIFDLDHDDSWSVVMDSGLPPPTYIVINPENGHAHVLYELASPVSTSSLSRLKPMQLVAAIERGFTRRLKADRGYTAVLCQNPFHGRWKTDAPALEPYEATRLVDCLSEDEKKFYPRSEPVFGLGRHCTLFEEVRKVAYRSVLRFKKEGKPEDAFRNFLEEVCREVNCKFQTPLPESSIRSCAKSVTKWVWRRFTQQAFSAIQSKRGKKRWSKNPLTMESVKPWVYEGMSRSTWYARKAKDTETT